MSFEPIETPLPDNIDAQLDQLLAEWRNHRQLAPIQAEKVRQAILATPGEFSAAGWKPYVDYLNGFFAQANYFPQSFFSALERGSTYRYKTSPKNVVQLRITPDWQPYLKLV